MKKLTLAFKYGIFAGISVLVNIGTQKLVLIFYSQEYSVYVAIMAGTATGLLAKYILDKRYIFYYTVESQFQNFSKFIMYSFMGVFTTLIFWGSELLFHYTFEHEDAKFIGALIGLTIGYLTKYHLDKKFVFVR